MKLFLTIVAAILTSVALLFLVGIHLLLVIVGILLIGAVVFMIVLPWLVSVLLLLWMRDWEGAWKAFCFKFDKL